MAATSDNQLWECAACGLAAEWHPPEEGGYYPHCACRAGIVFVMYTDRCNRCGGSGKVQWVMGPEAQCPDCKGTGK